MRVRRRIIVVILAAVMVSSSTAYMASDTVPGSSAGQGAGSVTQTTSDTSMPTTARERH